jgi:hypothetical protein
MATNDDKKRNMVRILQLTLVGVAKGVWDFVGETSLALSLSIGNTILDLLEKEMGLEISGGNPKEVLQEIGRICVDEFALATEVEPEETADSYILRLANCINRDIKDQMQALGITVPFVCPVMNVAVAAMKRMNVRVRHTQKKWDEKHGSIIILEKLD